MLQYAYYLFSSHGNLHSLLLTLISALSGIIKQLFINESRMVAEVHARVMDALSPHEAALRDMEACNFAVDVQRCKYRSVFFFFLSAC